MVASGGGMVGGEQAVWRVGAMWSGADLGVVGRVAWVGRMPVVRQKDGFTLPVAERGAHETQAPAAARLPQLTDRSLSLSLSVCLCTDNNVRR